MISFISNIDMAVIQALYDVRNLAVSQNLILVSELGRTISIYGLGFCIALLLLLRKRYVHIAGLAITLASSGVLILLAKGLIARERPPLFFRAYPEIWHSFPSAHATLITALYLLLIYMVWTLVPSKPLRIVVSVVLLACVLLVSFSRIYLGVHYLSDVLAGMALGAFCAWLGYRWILFAKQS